MSVENLIRQNSQRHTVYVTKLHHVVYHEQNYKIKTKCTKYDYAFKTKIKYTTVPTDAAR